MKVMQYFLTGLLLVIVFLDNARALPAEPVCSKFDYEMKTLEAMLRIENRAEKMMEEFKSVRDSLTKELDEIKNLKAEVERQQTAMKSKFTALKSEAEKQQTAMETAMESKFTALKSEVEEKTKPDEVTAFSVANPTKKIVNGVPTFSAVITNIGNGYDVDTDEVIAFSVANPTKKLVNGVPTFSAVITNIGNGYDVDTGIFTCPIGGLYTFVFTVTSNGQNDVYCRIRHNGANRVFGRSYTDNSYTTASVSVNLLLQKDDLVTLGDCYGWTNVDIYNGSTTFSGALIKRTS